MKKKYLIFLLAFIFLSVVVFLVMTNNSNKIETKIGQPRPSNNDEIELPLFPNSEKIYFLKSSDKKYYEIRFNVKLPYPSKKVLEFYRNELTTIDYETHIPDSYPYKNKIGDWQLGYLKTLANNPVHAQLDSFWINKENNKALWLILFYEWRNYGSLNNHEELEENENQHGIIFIFNLHTVSNLKKNDIYKYFMDTITNKDIKKVNDINYGHSDIVGFYDVKNGRFEFKVVTDFSEEENKNPKLKQIFDLNGNLHLIYKNCEFSEEDIEKAFVSIIDPLRNLSEKGIREMEIKKEELNKRYTLQLFIKKNSLQKVQKCLLRIKGQYLGIEKDNKLVSKIYVSESYTNDRILTIKGLNKKRIDFLLQGSIQEK